MRRGVCVGGGKGAVTIFDRVLEIWTVRWMRTESRMLPLVLKWYCIFVCACVRVYASSLPSASFLVMPAWWNSDMVGRPSIIPLFFNCLPLVVKAVQAARRKKEQEMVLKQWCEPRVARAMHGGRTQVEYKLNSMHANMHANNSKRKRQDDY